MSASVKNRGHWQSGQSGNPFFGKGGKLTSEFRLKCRQLTTEKVLKLFEREIQRCLDDPDRSVDNAFVASEKLLRYSFAPVRDTDPSDDSHEPAGVDASAMVGKTDEELERMLEEAGDQ